MTHVSGGSQHDSHIETWDTENRYFWRVKSIYVDANWVLWKHRRIMR